MSERLAKYTEDSIRLLIMTLRGQKVILDADLARIYGVLTRALNQAVKRNTDRFPPDFVFRLTPEEIVQLRRQPVITDADDNRSQIVTGSQKHRDPRYLPYAFTEHGAIMAANVLNSPQAVKMSVFVVRAFIRQECGVRVRGQVLQYYITLMVEKLLSSLALSEIDSPSSIGTAKACEAVARTLTFVGRQGGLNSCECEDRGIGRSTKLSISPQRF